MSPQSPNSNLALGLPLDENQLNCAARPTPRPRLQHRLRASRAGAERRRAGHAQPRPRRRQTAVTPTARRRLPIRVHADPRFPPTGPVANRLSRCSQRRIQSSLRAGRGRAGARRRQDGGGGRRGAGPRARVSVCRRMAVGGGLGGPCGTSRTPGVPGPRRGTCGQAPPSPCTHPGWVPGAASSLRTPSPWTWPRGVQAGISPLPARHPAGSWRPLHP